METKTATEVTPPTAEGIVTWCGVSREDERFTFLVKGIESMLRRYVETCGLAETHRDMCTRLREYVDWRHLGFGGESLDHLVLERARKLELMIAKLRGYILHDVEQSKLAMRLDKEALELMPHTEKQEAAPLTPKGCNRHTNCSVFDENYKKIHGVDFVPFNLHCHDDECEDCFGS